MASKWVRGRRGLGSTGMVWLLVAALLAPAAMAALKPETKAAYRDYIAKLDASTEARNGSEGDFLWIDRDARRRQAVRNGDIVTQKVKSFSVADGMVQHWIGGMFVPGASLPQVEKADQDFANYAKFYAPDVSHVRLISHRGNDFVVAYRITKTKVLTAVEDTVQDIDYIPLRPGRMAVRSQSQSVRQVEDAGKPSERVLAEGEGSGYLWAMNSYWRLREGDGGVYMECEAVTLSRGIPLGMGWMVDPILQSFAEESLKNTLGAKRRAIVSGL